MAARGKSAWLVTRHWIAEHPKWEVAAILSPRLGGDRVREFVELLQVTSYFTLEEQLDMKWPRYGRTPYPSRFGQTQAGESWNGEVFCGHDPYLHARVVDEVRIKRGAEGKETATWKERQRP